jgi:hypothetical protein
LSVRNLGVRPSIITHTARRKHVGVATVASATVKGARSILDTDIAAIRHRRIGGRVRHGLLDGG